MDNLIILEFKEAKQPEYKERKGSGYIEFGEFNDYPNYLLSLYNKSAKHNAIVRGKVNYIIGNGWESENDSADQFISNPNKYESLSEITRKISIDLEVFGGAYIEVIWSKFGDDISEIYHVDYMKIRSNKDNTQFYYKEDWSDRKKDYEVINVFNPNIRKGKQIMFLKEYRPSLKTYPLPNYMGCLNYIESDIKISEHILTNAMTGFTPSKLITLPNGEPSNEEKRNIEKRFEDRFTGSSGKKFILSFVQNADRKPLIDDLGSSDLTNEDFTRVDLIVQQNIYAGHQITTPTLFGIKTEGSLGSRTELRDGYEVFKNTYINDKQRFIEYFMNLILKYKNINDKITIVPVEPLNYEFSEATITANMTKDEIREKLNLPSLATNTPSQSQIVSDGINSLSPLVANKVLESMTQNEIRSLVGLAPQEGGDTIQSIDSVGTTGGVVGSQMQVNENLKNLTGRQHQQVLRLVRQFTKGTISKEYATTMLKSSLGLNDNEINTILGLQESFKDEEEDLSVFEQFGDAKDGYDILLSREFKFEDFADVTIADTIDKQLIQLLKKDPLIPISDLSKALNLKDGETKKRLKNLVDMEVVTSSKNGYEVVKPISDIINEKPKTTIQVMYSYEWKSVVPKNQRDTAEHPSRPFCQKLISLDKFYTRKDIEKLSQRLGYNVFDRGGGFWGDSPSCRHYWKSNVVIKRK